MALALDLTTERPIHRVYVDGSEVFRKSRVIEDLMERGMSKNDAIKAYESRSLDETPVIRQTVSTADIVVNMDALNILQQNEEAGL